MNISVIIPVYNVELYIEQCLRSLFTQTLTEGVEFIIINDASQDKSMEITYSLIKEFPELNILVLNNEVNLGIGTTRMIGINKIKGEYSIQIDGDDYCEATMLEQMWNKAKETNADIVICDYSDIYRNASVYKTQELKSDNIGNITALLKGELFGAMWNKLVRTSLYRDNNINHTPGINHQGDLVLSVKLFYFATNVTKLSRSLICYRHREGSIMKSNFSYKSSSLITNINELEAFCREKQIKEQVEIGLIEQKINLKYNFTINLKGKIRKEYLKMHPEVNHLIEKSQLRWVCRTILLAATNGYYSIADILVAYNNIYVALRKLVKKMIRRKNYELY